MQLSY